MSEDYLAKSGAKDMIATAIAEVLTLRPRVPVAFLASHFQGLVTNKSASVVSYLRVCHPSSPSFPSAVEKAFHDLATMEATPTPTLLTTTPPQRATSAGPTSSRKIRAGGPATISETSFQQLLQQLSADFPKPLQTKLLEAALSSGITTDTPNNQSVGLTRFRRGVQVCLLTEELIDAATLLFQGLQANHSDPDGVSGVDSDTLMNVLQSAASQFSRERIAELIPLLVRSTSRHLLQLSDVFNLLFGLVLEQSV
ncbi:hypothetical protein PPTG_18190 [Phytophthora nicotianae INRA-310]|uniref:RIIa domain-containing protein n=2 Tax=Phytophthora nicotianae TaxID=4792 RepID=W2PIX1_PHYN3|nr:hypothetical protein PPTG_18190 [Phytophthora nicotianae INRA-310]ETI32162.1 hypothetical protein F443_20950 [Phytophthora nicotianae P1569]ETN00189.1 hypothetical protein PPTG_18190 [Phytophthora nicotianae INRA-310]